MYSGPGQSLPCFETGDLAINELILRFNPLGNSSHDKVKLVMFVNSYSIIFHFFFYI